MVRPLTNTQPKSRVVSSKTFTRECLTKMVGTPIQKQAAAMKNPPEMKKKKKRTKKNLKTRRRKKMSALLTKCAKCKIRISIITTITTRKRKRRKILIKKKRRRTTKMKRRIQNLNKSLLTRKIIIPEREGFTKRRS